MFKYFFFKMLLEFNFSKDFKKMRSKSNKNYLNASWE